jgi:hypothetical protein
MSYTDFRSYSELYHHGILGMHWGIRRFQNKDGSLTGAGKKRYDVGSKRDSSKDKILNERDIINVGNSVIRNRSEEKSLNLFESQKKYWTNFFKNQGDNDQDAESKAKDYAAWDVVTTQDYRNYSDFGNNCPNCALSVELKKRGINVRPKGNRYGLTAEQIHEVYVGEKTTKCTSKSDFFDKKNYGPPGSHGQLFGYYVDGGGHTLNYTVLSNGTVQIEDAQVGKVWTSFDDLRRDMDYGAMNRFYCGEIMNLTQAEIDMDYVKDANMVDTSNYQNNNELRLRQYEDKVKGYVKKIKTLETVKYAAMHGIVKTILKKMSEKVKGLFKKPSK